jgi:hypothetical protein
MLSLPLEKLAAALDSEEYSELCKFVCHDSDGLGNPLPKEVCDNLGLAVIYLNHSIPDQDKTALLFFAKPEAHLPKSKAAAPKGH